MRRYIRRTVLIAAFILSSAFILQPSSVNADNATFTVSSNNGGKVGMGDELNRHEFTTTDGSHILLDVNSSSNALLYYVQPPHSATWTSNTVLSSGVEAKSTIGNGATVSVTSDAANNAYIIYMTNATTPNLNFIKLSNWSSSTHTYGTIGTPVTLFTGSTGNIPDTFGNIIFEPNSTGKLWIIFTKTLSTSPCTGSCIDVISSTNGGTSFNSAYDLVSSAPAGTTGMLTTYGTSSIAAIYEDGNGALYYATHPNANADTSWNAAVNIQPSSANFTSTHADNYSAATDSSGNIHLVYTLPATTALTYQEITAAGGLQSAVSLSTPTNWNAYESVATDGTNVYIAGYSGTSCSGYMIIMVGIPPITTASKFKEEDIYTRSGTSTCGVFPDLPSMLSGNDTTVYWTTDGGTGAYAILQSNVNLYGFYQSANAGSGSYNDLGGVIDEGGLADPGSSANYKLSSSIGQTGQFIQSSSHFIIKSGFEYYDYGFDTPYVSFSLNTNSINLGTLTANTFSTGSNTATVTTNAIHGYTMYAQENHALQNLSNASITIPPFTGSSTTSAVSWTAPATNGFGYNVAGADASTDFVSSSYFRAFDAASAHAIASTTGPTQTAGGDTATITYQVSPSGSAGAGTYTNTITYTVVGTY